LAGCLRVGVHAIAAVPRLGLSREEAASAIGSSLSFFEEHVEPELRAVRRGRRKFFAVSEIQRWLDENAERIFGAAS
jgi:hypothetical protein